MPGGQSAGTPRGRVVVVTGASVVVVAGGCEVVVVGAGGAGVSGASTAGARSVVGVVGGVFAVDRGLAFEVGRRCDFTDRGRCALTVGSGAFAGVANAGVATDAKLADRVIDAARTPSTVTRSYTSFMRVTTPPAFPAADCDVADELSWVA